MSLVGPLRSVMRIWSLQKSYFLYYQPCFSHEFGATEVSIFFLFGENRQISAHQLFFHNRSPLVCGLVGFAIRLILRIFKNETLLMSLRFSIHFFLFFFVSINFSKQMIVGVPPWYPDRLQYLNHDLMDLSVENILPCFSQESFDFIDRGIESGGVLVHCMKVCVCFHSEFFTTHFFFHCSLKQGKSRSASMVLAYLMRENGWSLKETLDYVQEKRPLVQPNEGFLEQLRQFEKNHSLQEKKER